MSERNNSDLFSGMNSRTSLAVRREREETKSEKDRKRRTQEVQLTSTRDLIQKEIDDIPMQLLELIEVGDADEKTRETIGSLKNYLALCKKLKAKIETDLKVRPTVSES